MTGKETIRKPRSISLDILRIIAMAMVVLLHITGHGLKNADVIPYGCTYWLVTVTNTFSLVAVNCFVLISGYFLCTGNPRPKKLVSLWLQVATYSVGVYLVLCLIPGAEVSFSLRRLIEFAAPLLTGQYWFFTCYFLLYLLAPILNKLISVLDRREYEQCLILLLILFSLIPSINVFGDSFRVNGGYSLLWFIVLYLIAGYLRQYPLPRKFRPGLAYVLACLILVGIRAVQPVFTGSTAISTVLNAQLQYNGPLMLIASVGLFLWFVRQSPEWSTTTTHLVSRVGSLSFGVYLLHEHNSLRSIVWNKLVRMEQVADHPAMFLLRMLLSLVLIFAAGITVEWLRVGTCKLVQRIFQKRKI